MQINVRNRRIYRKNPIKGLHILLVEDNELNMEIAELMFRNEGAVVTKAWNGQEAVEIFKKSRPGEIDVILMDIMMPVMNGYEATKIIRSMGQRGCKGNSDYRNDSKCVHGGQTESKRSRNE